MSSRKSVVGDLINFRGLVYSPMNENGVVFLFGKVAEDLNMYIEEIKPGFPDCAARRFTGKGWERVSVEFEYKSSNFQQHGHDPNGCDMIICWEHDWKDCPLEVIELRDRIQELENRPIRRPDQEDASDGRMTIDEWFAAHEIPRSTQNLFPKLVKHIGQLDEECFYKVGQSTVTFYSPERVFMYLNPQKTLLRLELFTGGKALGKVTQCKGKTGQKWGRVSVQNENKLEQARPWIKESLKRLKDAVKRNEPTSWHSNLNETEQGDADAST